QRLRGSPGGDGRRRRSPRPDTVPARRRCVRLAGDRRRRHRVRTARSPPSTRIRRRCEMTVGKMLGLALLLSAGPTGPWLAEASVDVHVREQGLPHVCEKGTRARKPCDPEAGDPQNDVDGCPGGTCVLKVIAPKFKGTLTILTDENVSTFT